MVDNTYRFYLHRDATTYYTVVGNAVTTVSTPTPLADEPAGWKAMNLTYARNETYWGIFRTYALELQFVLSGAKILKHIYFNEGYEGQCILTIEKRNTIDGTYSFWSSGEIDFSQVVIEDNFVTTNVLQRGLPEFFENKKDITYEVPIESDAMTVRLDGIKIRGTINWTPVSYVAPGSLAIPNLTMLYRTSEIGKRYVPDNINQQSNFDFTSSGTTPDLVSRFSNNCFFKATTEDPIKIRYGGYRITFNQSPLIAQSLFIMVTTELGVHVEDIILQTQDADDIARSTIGEITINPTIGYRYTLCVGGSPAWQDPGGSTYFQVSDFSQSIKATFEMDYVIRLPATGTRGYRYIDFAKKLVELASEGRYSVVSNFLSDATTTTATARKFNIDSSPYWLIVTSAQSIRGFANSKIKATIADMCKDLWARYGCAVSMDGNNLRIEPLSYYFKNEEAYELADAKDIKISPFTTQIFNSFKIGYPDNTYDELSGLDEFNTTQEYSLDAVTRISKSEDLLAPFRSDMYGIEWLRNKRNSIAANDPWAVTMDSSSDNDTFAIEVDPVPVVALDGSLRYLVYKPVGYIAGLTDADTAYNIVQSPHRMLRRHLNRIASLTYARGNVVYQTTDKNAALESNFFAGLTVEAKSETLYINPWPTIPINPLFLPVVFEFTTIPPDDLVPLMDADPNKYVKFRYKGRELKGYVLDVSRVPATREARIYRLLSHPENDLQNLI